MLAIAAGALRNFLRQRGVLVDDVDFRVVVPVNVRAEGERSALGNRVSELIARLPLAEADPWKRLLAVVDMTHELKASGQSGAGDLLGQAVDLLPTQLLTPLFRLASRSSVANLILTNVPGPRVPVYLLGARQLETYPVVPLLGHQALGIALMSYDDGLFWGFNADWDAVPDLHDLVEHVETGFAELRARHDAVGDADRAGNRRLSCARARPERSPRTTAVARPSRAAAVPGSEARYRPPSQASARPGEAT